MTDESKPTPIILPEQRQTPEVHSNHYCEHPGCKSWGSWGFPAGHGQTKWFCGTHKDDAER